MALLDRTGWTATASSVYNLNTADKVLDGNTGTYWMSYPPTGYPHWLKVNLGAPRTFDAIYYGRSSGNYLPATVEVYLSDDDVTYTLVATVTWPKKAIGYTEVVMIPRATKQYVKIVGLTGYAGLGRMSCVEFNLGLDPLNRSAWTATATSYYDADHAPQMALDGYDESTYSFWLSDASFPQRIAVDMQTPQLINYVRYGNVSGGSAPIYTGQPVPALARLYISNLTAPDVNNLGDWTLVGEQYWPDDKRNHYVYIWDAEGVLLPTSARHFMLEGVHETRYSGTSTYHRMACAEIYAGLLAAGNECKVYYQCHPNSFYIFPDNPVEELELRSDVGIIDTLENQPGPAKWSEPVVAVCNSRLWHHAPLVTHYPEAMFWNWDFPDGFPDELPVETVTRILEGSVTDASTLTASMYYSVSSLQESAWKPGNENVPVMLTTGAWSGVKMHTIWDAQTNPGDDSDDWMTAHQYGHLWLWGSTSATSPDHEIDVGRMDLTDIYYLIVWEALYIPPDYPAEEVDISGSNLTFSGQLTVSRTPSGPTPCPDIIPGLLPPTPAPIPLECFHLVVAHPEDGIYVQFDFTNWLAPGDALSSATWTADAGVILDAQSSTTTTASLTASIPLAADGEEYFLKCSAITELELTEIRRVQVQVRTANFGTQVQSGWWRV